MASITVTSIKKIDAANGKWEVDFTFNRGSSSLSYDVEYLMCGSDNTTATSEYYWYAPDDGSDFNGNYSFTASAAENTVAYIKWGSISYGGESEVVLSKKIVFKTDDNITRISIGDELYRVDSLLFLDDPDKSKQYSTAIYFAEKTNDGTYKLRTSDSISSDCKTLISRMSDLYRLDNTPYLKGALDLHKENSANSNREYKDTTKRGNLSEYFTNLYGYSVPTYNVGGRNIAGYGVSGIVFSNKDKSYTHASNFHYPGGIYSSDADYLNFFTYQPTILGNYFWRDRTDLGYTKFLRNGDGIAVWSRRALSDETLVGNYNLKDDKICIYYRKAKEFFPAPLYKVSGGASMGTSSLSIGVLSVQNNNTQWTLDNDNNVGCILINDLLSSHNDIRVSLKGISLDGGSSFIPYERVGDNIPFKHISQIKNETISKNLLLKGDSYTKDIKSGLLTGRCITNIDNLSLRVTFKFKIPTLFYYTQSGSGLETNFLGITSSTSVSGDLKYQNGGGNYNPTELMQTSHQANVNLSFSYPYCGLISSLNINQNNIVSKTFNYLDPESNTDSDKWINVNNGVISYSDSWSNIRVTKLLTDNSGNTHYWYYTCSGNFNGKASFSVTVPEKIETYGFGIVLWKKQN